VARTQSLILDAITAAVEKRGLTLANDGQWANNGTLRVYDKALNQVGAVSYDFQNNYVHFGPVSNRLAALWYGQSAEGKADWVVGSIPELVDRVVNHITNTPKGGKP
jgi:hypothetical protein